MKNLYGYFLCSIISLNIMAQTAGGPDQYGYVWVNSNDPNGPAFNWIDISSFPGVTSVSGLTDDNVVGPFQMPIPFFYYGNYITQFWIGSNGYIIFQFSQIAHPFPNIPSVIGANNFIAPFMSDLNFQGTGNPGQVSYWSNFIGDTLIVSFIDVPFWDNSASGFTGSNSFQVILASVDNSITFQYLMQIGASITTPDFISVGIENQTGAIGLEILHDSYPTAGISYKISTPQFNLISGKLFIDNNNNQIFDSNDQALKYRIISEQNSNRLAITNEYGDYHFLILDTGTFSVSPAPINYYSVSPISHTSVFTALQQVDSLNNFILTPSIIVNDLQITISPISPFRPGFDSHYNIHYKNIGTTSLQGTIIFYRDSVLTYVTSSVAPVSVTTDSITWQTPLLYPFAEGDILVTLNVDPSTPNGYWVNSLAKIEPIFGDTNPSDNIAEWRIETTGSFDPNDILVNRNSIQTTELTNPPYLEYLIRFQNTGTDTAFTVKVKNPIPVNAQINSFELLEASHPMQVIYNDFEEVLWFNFDNIMLPDSNVNEILSHGYIRYKIKPLSTLFTGDSIKNSAAIYFDFNAPVITNTAVTEIVLPSSVTYINDIFNFSIYPNPAKHEINVSFIHKNTSTIKLQLYNNLGQVLYEFSDIKTSSGINKIKLSAEKLKQGIYFLKITVEGETITRKLIKI